MTKAVSLHIRGARLRVHDRELRASVWSSEPFVRISPEPGEFDVRDSRRRITTRLRPSRRADRAIQTTSHQLAHIVMMGRSGTRDDEGVARFGRVLEERASTLARSVLVRAALGQPNLAASRA